MQDIIEYNGKRWRPITEADIPHLAGKKVLYTAMQHFGPTTISSIDRSGDYINLRYAGLSPWHTSGGSWFVNDPSPYYIEDDSIDTTLCYCGGLTKSRWCFDTNKVEPICVRCRKRKSNGKDS